MGFLEERSQQSKTVKLWVDVVIKPMFITMAYIRAEREGDWLLHLSAFRQMIPYFFAAGHFNYARYGSYYLRSMEKLPQHVLDHFLKGEHVMHHLRGLWNGIWSDQFIESTFMRFGHSSGGIIGITLKPEALEVWALSRHICCQILMSLKEIEDGEDNQMACQTHHKEEGNGRIILDAKDREGLRKKLEVITDPLDPENHTFPGEIVNIVTGKLGTSAVNVSDAVAIGETIWNNLEKSWPDGFYGTIPKKVTTMAVTNKSVPVGDTKVYDMNAIYSSVIGLLASGREIDLKDLFSHEMATVPSAMFNENGMKICKTKSVLKRNLQVEMSNRTLHPDATVIDGSALLWTINWPSEGTVNDFVTNVKNRLKKYLEKTDVYLVFDRYHDFCTKLLARGGRETGVTRTHQLRIETKLPAQKVVLTGVENKKAVD